jgi:hypothetical protein
MGGGAAKAFPTEEIAPAIDLKCAGWQTFRASVEAATGSSASR